MTLWKLAGTTALVTMLVSGAVQAEVTPEEVWQNWQDLSASYGQAMTADSAVRQGDTLVVSGVTIRVDQDETKVSGTLKKVSFRDLGDGTVEVTMSDSYPLTVVSPDSETGEPTTVTIMISQPGLVLIAGGNADETSYDFDAPTLTIKLDSVEGMDASDADLTVNATLTGVTGSYLVSGDDVSTDVESVFEAASLSLVVDVADPETDGTVRATMTVASLASEGAGTLLDMAAMADFAQALQNGFAFDSAFSFGATSFDFEMLEGGVPTSVSGSAEGGTLYGAMDAEALYYSVGGTGMSVTVSGGQMPFPEVTVSYAELLFDLLMPIAKSDEPSDFSFLTRIVDLAISDEIWGMFDPAGNLPRTPATLIIDTSGTVRLTADLMNETAMDMMGEAPPGELHSLDLGELRASFAGAELTGSGAFTFDNTDLATFGGLPAPTGKLDLRLIGANALLDKLVAMGIIPQEEAFGYRAGAAMIANTGPGEDELTSTLEFKDKGFFANGQRLQ